MQSIPPHPTSWRSILILSSHLHLGLPICLFPSGHPHQDRAYTSPLPPYMLYARPISIFSILNNIPHHPHFYYEPVVRVDPFPKVFYKGGVPGPNLGLCLRGFIQSVFINSKIIPKLSHVFFALYLYQSSIHGLLSFDKMKLHKLTAAIEKPQTQHQD